MEIKCSLSERLKNLRKESGKTISDISIDLDISASAISNYERGLRSPDADTIIKMVNYFNVTADYLLGITEYKNIEEKELHYGKYEAIDYVFSTTDVETQKQFLSIIQDIFEGYSLLDEAERIGVIDKSLLVSNMYLNTVSEIITSMVSVCNDFWIVAEGVYHRAFDNILANEEFKVYESEIISNSEYHTRLIINCINIMMGSITGLAIKLLKDYFRLDDSSTELSNKFLNELSRKIREMKENDKEDMEDADSQTQEAGIPLKSDYDSSGNCKKSKLY